MPICSVPTCGSYWPLYRGNILDHTLEETHVFYLRLNPVAFGQFEHGIGHIQAISKACRANAPRGKQHIDATSTAKIKHFFPQPQFGQRIGIAAAQRGKRRRHRQLTQFRAAIEVAGNSITIRCSAAATTATAAGSECSSAQHLLRGARVALAYCRS